MFPEGFAYKCRAIEFGSTRGLVGCQQELLIKNDLDCFHMSALLHSILHIQLDTLRLVVGDRKTGSCAISTQAAPW